MYGHSGIIIIIVIIISYRPVSYLKVRLEFVEFCFLVEKYIENFSRKTWVKEIILES
jgi:hypothetical protein